MSQSIEIYNNKSRDIIKRIIDILHYKINSSYPSSDEIIEIIDNKVKNRNLKSFDKYDYLHIKPINAETFLRLIVSFIVNPCEETAKIVADKVEHFKTIAYDIFDKTIEINNKHNFLYDEHTTNEMFDIYMNKTLRVYSENYNLVNPDISSSIDLYCYKPEFKYDLKYVEDGMDIIEELRKPFGRGGTKYSSLYVNIADYILYLDKIIDWSSERGICSYLSNDDLLKMILVLPSTSNIGTNIYISNDVIDGKNVEMSKTKYVSIKNLFDLFLNFDDKFIKTNKLRNDLFELKSDDTNKNLFENIKVMETRFLNDENNSNSNYTDEINSLDIIVDMIDFTCFNKYINYLKDIDNNFPEIKKISNNEIFRTYSKELLINNGDIKNVPITNRYISYDIFILMLNNLVTSLKNYDMNKILDVTSDILNEMNNLNNTDEVNEYIKYMNKKCSVDIIKTIGHVNKLKSLLEKSNIDETTLNGFIERLNIYESKKYMLM